MKSRNALSPRKERIQLVDSNTIGIKKIEQSYLIKKNA